MKLGIGSGGRRIVALGLMVTGGLVVAAVLFTSPFGGEEKPLDVAARGSLDSSPGERPGAGPDAAQPTSPPTTPPEPEPDPHLGTVVTATRQGEMVKVERRDLDTGRSQPLFTYEEKRRYPAPDDPSVPDQPSVSLSPDGRRVAYSDIASIRIRDLTKGTTRTVVSGVPQGEEMPLHWSIPEMNTDPETDGVWGIWGVHDPEWSPDGQRLAFNQGWWEGSDFGIVDLVSGRYHATCGGFDLEWTDDGRAVTAGSSYTEPGRVFVARPDLPGEYTDVTAGAPEQRSYDDVAVAPDGQRLAVTWAEEAMMTERCCAALLDIDGTLIRQLPSAGMIQSMAFATDNSSLYLTERRDGRTLLMRHPVTGEATTEVLVLPADLYAWTIATRSDGTLALVGRTRAAYEGDGPLGCEQNCPPYRSRLLVVDPATGETLYESADLGRFTAIGGFWRS